MPPDAQDDAQSFENGARGEVEKKDDLAPSRPARMGDGVMGENVDDDGDVDGPGPAPEPNEYESERT